MDVEELTRRSIRSPGEGGGKAAAPLHGTERRDEVTADSRHRDTARHGRVFETVCRLDGERIGHRAAELLPAAHRRPDPG